MVVKKRNEIAHIYSLTFELAGFLDEERILERGEQYFTDLSLTNIEIFSGLIRTHRIEVLKL
jgi:hypothetical protein